MTKLNTALLIASLLTISAKAELQEFNKDLSITGCVDCFNFVAPTVNDATTVSPAEIGLIVYDSGDSRFKGRDDLGNWQNLNSGTINIKSVTAAYTAAESDEMIVADATTAAFNVTLPDLADVPEGKKITIKKEDSSTNAVGFTLGSGDSIQDGTVELNTEDESVTFVSDGTDWQVLDHRIPKGYKSVEPVGTSTSAADTWVDVGSASLTLGVGTWAIGYSSSLDLRNETASTQGARANLAIRTSGGAIQNGSVTLYWNKVENDQDKVLNQSREIEVTVTSETTYKLSIRCDKASSTVACKVLGENITGALTNPDNENIFYARKIR